MQVLQPIWLFAMVAVVIPLIIHLWNDKRGKTLLIGSVAFLDQQSRRQSRSPRISEWLLLLLRCLLLLVLALLLAGPMWRRPPAVAARGWVLLSDTSQANGEHKGLIDSLLRAGYQRHLLGESGGMTGNREAGPGGHEDKTGNQGGPQPSWWADFIILDHRAPAGIPFYVFTDGRMVHFRGRRPWTDRKVNWVPDRDTLEVATNRIAAAWTIGGGNTGEENSNGGRNNSGGGDSIGVLTLSSRSTGSLYSYHSELRGGRQSLSMDSQTVALDPSVLRVRIVADNKYNNDGGYLEAAIRALQKFTHHNIRVVVDDSARADWVFWLSAAPLPAGLLATRILVYQPGREIPVDTWVEGMDVAVSRIVASGPDSGGIVWKDGFGKSLLSLEEREGKKIFHFYSHFDPAWNGLVWSPRFPAVMASLLLEDGVFPGADFVQAADDRRVVDPQQVMPWKRKARDGDSLKRIVEENEALMAGGVTGTDEYAEPAGPSPDIDLAPACWLLAFLLLALERWISYRTIKKPADG